MNRIKRIIVLLCIFGIFNVTLCSSENYEEPALHGFHVMQVNGYNGDNNANKVNVTLWIKDWNEKIYFSNLNVTIFDLKENKISSDLTNETGCVDLRFLPTGSYVVIVKSGNRTVGYQRIKIEKSKTFVIRTWAYELNMTLVDEHGDPLANHTVYIYDQMVFREPNYTIVKGDVKRYENYTVIVDHEGALVCLNETDNNGTVRFTGLWNGTYRIKVYRKGMRVKKYVLGKLISVYEEPVSGEYVLNLQESSFIKLKCVKRDLKLKFISESNIPIQNATVYVRNRNGHLYFKDITNETGIFEHKNVFVIDDFYAVSVMFGNRTVGYELINATKPGVFTIKCWAYNLTVKCVDQENNPLTDHIVFLYDQLIFYTPTNITKLVNQTGTLVNWTKTDENGTAFFTNIWNGTYRIRVLSGEIVGDEEINLQKTTFILLKCNKTYLTLRLLTGSGMPLSNATVYIHDSAGHLIFRDYPDQNGYIHHEGIYVDRYTVFVKWMGRQVWSGNLDTYKNREFTIKCSVFNLIVRVEDPFGNPIRKANVTLTTAIRGWSHRSGISLRLKTDENGYVSCLLPSDTYDISSSYGIYSGFTIVDLTSDHQITLRCEVQLNLWILTFLIASSSVALTVLLERKNMRKHLEIRRYKKLLSKLDEMYTSGLVEYKIYRKLREEYEANLMKLGGREMR